MAKIKSMNFYSTDKVECTCDRCGQGIKNVWTVKFDDGLTANFGMDCIDKMCKSSKLNDYGTKLLKKLMKSIRLYEERLAVWKELDEETARSDENYAGVFAELDPASYVNQYSKSCWCGKTFEEYKEWAITELYPSRIEDTQKEIEKKFGKINFKAL